MNSEREPICKDINAATKLITAVFGGDICTYRKKLGLPVPPTKKELRDERERTKWVVLICEDCGQMFRRRQYQVIASFKHGQKHVFCNKVCFGRWASKEYGFIAHPQNIRLNYTKRKKYDYELVWKTYLASSAKETARTLNMPVQSVWNVVKIMRPLK